MAKEWSWSYSRKKNYDECPRRHQQVDVLKNFKDETEALLWGNKVHEALAQACSSGAPLPEGMDVYKKWVDVVRAAPGRLFVEQKYAITRQFEKTDWFAPNVWFRSVSDLEKHHGDTVSALDWKTGKVLHDSKQLMLAATCIFVHHPQINTVKTRFVWLKDDCTTADTFTRATIMQEWTALFPQLEAWEIAAKANNYPPKPGRLCRRWCPVKTCEYHPAFTKT